MKYPSKAKIYHAHTNDGWKIALHRHRSGKRKYPVLLVHGLASNYRNLDFPIKDLSLAHYLKKNGFDAWIVDLRGSGLSKRKNLGSIQWFIDDYAFQDLPAAAELVLHETKAKKFHWIGHSLGGLLAYPFSQTYHKKKVIKSLTTIAAPPTPEPHGYFKFLFRYDSLLRVFPWLPYKSLSKIAAYFSDYLLRFEDHLLFSRNNMDKKILNTLLDHAVESVPSSIIRQLHDWMRNNYFGSRDGKMDYLEHAYKIQLPTLMIAGSLDSFTPTNQMRKVFRKLPTNKKSLIVFGKKRGHENDYGHIDLVIGKNAPKEVYPQILDWLQKNDR